MIGQLSSFSPAVAFVKENFINKDPFWISVKKDTLIFILGRNTLTFKDKNNNENSIDISFVTTDYKVPFGQNSLSGYIPTSLLTFGDRQLINAFIPSIPRISISKKEFLKSPIKFKKWWIKNKNDQQKIKRKSTKKEKSIKKEKSTKKEKPIKKIKKNNNVLSPKKEGGANKKRVSPMKKSYRKKSSKRLSRKKKACKRNKISRVMREFKIGKLKMKSGKVVVNRKQAIAIALSESDKYC
jgi:hypothetical protein